MPEYPRLSAKEAEKLLFAKGFELLRQKGSHRQFEHPVTHKKVTVPFIIKKNIELSVKRQIKENERILDEKVY